MKPAVRRALWFLLALGLGAALLGEFVRLPDASPRVDALPLSGFGFAGRDLPLNDHEHAIFGHARVLKRLYQVGRQRVVVQIIDATRDRHAVHDPMFCFRGAGWEPAARRPLPVPGGAAEHFALQRGGNRAEAVVWFSNGHTRHASAPRHWRETIARRLTLGRSGPEPVLVILQPLAGETVDWTELFDRFPALFDV